MSTNVPPTAESFTQPEADTLKGLGKYASKLGYVYIVVAIFMFMSLIQRVASGGLAFASGLLLIIMGGGLLAGAGAAFALLGCGRGLTQSGRAFDSLIHTDWSDRDNLTMAVDSLKGAFTLQVVLCVFAVLSAVATVVNLFLADPTGAPHV